MVVVVGGGWVVVVVVAVVVVVMVAGGGTCGGWWYTGGGWYWWWVVVVVVVWWWLVVGLWYWWWVFDMAPVAISAQTSIKPKNKNMKPMKLPAKEVPKTCQSCGLLFLKTNPPVNPNPFAKQPQYICIDCCIEKEQLSLLKSKKQQHQ